MTTIKITKEFHFESSHALKDYDGLCRNVHGHSYRLFVTIKGKILEDASSPKDGMVMDFGTLKDIVNDEIISKFDHALILNDSINESIKSGVKKVTERVIFTKFQPTCENLVSEFARLIQMRLPESVSLFRVKLYESATSYAEWEADYKNN